MSKVEGHYNTTVINASNDLLGFLRLESPASQGLNPHQNRLGKQRGSLCTKGSQFASYLAWEQGFHGVYFHLREWLKIGRYFVILTCFMIVKAYTRNYFNKIVATKQI